MLYEVITSTGDEVLVIIADVLRKSLRSTDYCRITSYNVCYTKLLRLWYYANKNTLIDGGKHNQDNFIVSEILTTSSQLEAARLGRIAVETYVIV